MKQDYRKLVWAFDSQSLYYIPLSPSFPIAHEIWSTQIDSDLTIQIRVRSTDFLNIEASPITNIAVANAHGELWIIFPAGESPVLLLEHEDPSFIFNPIWSPDGQYIAFETNAKGSLENYDIGIVNVNTGEAQILTDLTSNSQIFRELSNKISWSPDNESIMFAAQDIENNTYIWKVNLKDLSLIQLTQ